MSTVLPSPRISGRRARRDRRSRRRLLHLRMIGAPAIAALVVAIGAVGFVRSWQARPTLTVVVATPAPAPAPAAVPTPVASEPTGAQLVDAAQAAVAAWGRFATSGDLGEVDGHFVREGPQYLQFEREAGAREAAAGDPPYRFTLSGAELLDERPDGDRVVRGDLELARDGQPSQLFRWDLRLRQGPDGVWRVWTVLEAPPG